MNLNYEPLSFENLPKYKELFELCKIESSDYGFANMWGWQPHYNLEWKFEGDLCWIKQHSHGQISYWAPVGDWSKISNWKDYKEISSGNVFTRVPEELCNIWLNVFGNQIKIEEERGQWDYVYLAEDLASLKGNKFHKKKNLVNQFKNLYNYEYSAITKNCVEEVLKMQVKWCEWRDCESSEVLLAENDAVARILSNWDKFGDLQGGIIRIDGTPCAYTLAEQLTEDTIVIHFEKASNELKGSYQMINFLFANTIKDSYQFINREQDVDDEGLRKAKLSYNPVKFVKKNKVTFL